MAPESQATIVLEGIRRGEDRTAELFALVYEELRRRAKVYMAHEPPGHTLQATVLVHEAYVKMVNGPAVCWEDRRHFFNAAAEAMRQILVDYARRRRARKRGGGQSGHPGGGGRIGLEHAAGAADPLADAPDGRDDEVDLEALDPALSRLRELDRRRYQVVMLRYFSGLPEKEVAELLNVNVKTVQRDWKTAKLFLLAEMS